MPGSGAVVWQTRLRGAAPRDIGARRLGRVVVVRVAVVVAVTVVVVVMVVVGVVTAPRPFPASAWEIDGADAGKWRGCVTGRGCGTGPWGGAAVRLRGAGGQRSVRTAVMPGVTPSAMSSTTAETGLPAASSAARIG